MYKIIAIDLDGTLLNSFGEITPKTKDVLQRAIKNGVKVILASGRPVSAIENIATEIGSKEYLISGNGALVYDMRENEVVYDKFLTKEQVLEIVDICEENSIYCNVYTETEVIAKALNYNVLFYHKENAKKPEGKRTSINIVSNLRRYIEDLDENENFLKMLFNLNLYVGGGLYLLSAVLNIHVLKYLDYSVVLPLTSITYIWTMVLSYFSLKERITAKKVLGVALIVGGAVLVSL